MVDSCIASGSKSQLITSLLSKFDERDLSFLWPCNVSFGQKSNVDAAAVVAGPTLKIYVDAVAPYLTLDLSRSDSAVSGHALLDVSMNNNEPEKVELKSERFRSVVVFPTPDIAQRFIKHVTSRISTAPRSQPQPQPHDELDATDNDVLHVAQSKQFVQSATAAWHDWLKKSSVPSQIQLTTVVVSVSCQLHSNTHDVFVLTNCAIFLVKQRDFGIIRKLIPLHALQSVSYSTKESGICNVLLQPNIALTKTQASDVILTVDESGQEVLVAALARQFEAITTERLPVSRSDDVFWEKRGFVESQLIRVVNAVRLQSGAASEKKNLSKETSIRSLAWLVEFQPLDLVEALCEQSLLDQAGEIESRRFLARCVLQAARQFDHIDSIIEAVASWEIRRALEQTGSRSTSGCFLRSNNFACVLLSEFVGSSGDKCLRVLLSQVFEDFCSDDSQVKFGESDVVKWTTRLVSAILRGSETAVSLVSREVQLVASALSRAATNRVPDHVGEFVADFVFGHFLVPSFKKPHKHGIVSAAPSAVQLQNMSMISDVVAWLANGNFDHVDELTGMFQTPSTVELNSSLKQSSSVQSLGYQYHSLMVDFAQNLTQGAVSVQPVVLRSRRPLQVSDVHLSKHNVKLLEAIHKELEFTTGTILAVACSQQQNPFEENVTVGTRSSPRSQHQTEKVGKEIADVQKLEESNAVLTARSRQLQSAVEDLQRMCTTALSDAADLQRLLQQRDNEILQLRHLLQPSSGSIQSPRGAPALLAQEETKKQGSRGIFGCPLDGFALDLYSPISGPRR